MADILLTTFNFEVWFDRESGDGPREFGDGGFQEVTGLEVEMDVSDYEEGGRNDGVTRRIGRAKYQPLVCKRGMFGPVDGFAEDDLWQWFQDIVSGVRPVRRYNGTVIVNDQTDLPMASWRFLNAIPSKIVGPQLNATTGAIAIEELHLVHEGLQLEGTT